MVLIHNKIGDLKTGRQGDAIYQLRYGRQIRRAAAKKAPMPSKLQLDRRQLYRQALEWRKNLSQHDTIVLEQIAYHYHYTDSEGIPFTWDKMALKIALEVPTLEIIS